MLKNYHTQSIKWEEQYKEQLKHWYGLLIIDLNEIKELTKTNVKETIASWNKKYKDDIFIYTYELLTKLDRYSNKLIVTEETERQQIKQIQKLTHANIEMMNVTTDYIENKFVELGILERKYNYSDDLATKFLHSVTNQVNDKLDLFATMSVISDLRELIFGNAKSDGWTEYQWRTQRDSKVRATHAEMDNKWVAFDDPSPQPVGCHVGEDYNCRCYAINFRKPDGNGGWIYKYPI